MVRVNSVRRENRRAGRFAAPKRGLRSAWGGPVFDIPGLDDVRLTLDPALQHGLGLGLVAMMFAVALSLRPEHFAFLKTDPWRYAGGVAAQIVGLPALTLALVFLLKPVPSVALGMLVVAACPGGNVSNLLTHFARGNAAYSVSLTATSSILAALVTPTSILLWSSLYPPTAALMHRIDLDPIAFLIQTGITLAVPLLAGMTLALRAPKIAARIQPFFAVLALAILIALVIAGVVQFRDLWLEFGLALLPLVALHNAAAFGFGALAGRAMAADVPVRRALTFEVGIQNAGLGLLLLLTQFDGLGGAAALVGAWSVWHLIAGGALAGLFRALDRAKPAPLSPQETTT